jgi:hypothetical protein
MVSLAGALAKSMSRSHADHKKTQSQYTSSTPSCKVIPGLEPLKRRPRSIEPPAWTRRTHMAMVRPCMPPWGARDTRVRSELAVPSNVRWAQLPPGAAGGHGGREGGRGGEGMEKSLMERTVSQPGVDRVSQVS